MKKTNLHISLTINSEENLLGQLKSFHTRSNECLKECFDAGTNIRELVTTRSKHVDILLATLWEHINITNDFSLIAVGGYGRGELHPFSDIDLLILVTESSEKKQLSLLSQFITLLWDTGLILGHATRTLKECVSLAKEDLSVITNLMESRLLCGNEAIYQQMKELTSPSEIWNAEKFFFAKINEQRQRYKKFDGSSYDLEPNVKSSPGGLRDIQLIGWIAQRYYYPQSLLQLIKQKIITKKEYYALVKCQFFIWKIRFALHIISGKSEDRLLFDYQKDIAKLMGFKDSKNLLAVEKMMKRYYRSVLIIRNISDILIQSLEEDMTKTTLPSPPIIIDKNFQLTNHRIDAIDSNVFNSNPSQLLNIFYLVAENSEVRGITASTLRAIRAARNKIDKNFLNSKTNKQLFIQFWNIKHSSSRAMFLMKKSGVLSDYLPAFKKINGQMQYDMFHSYTVDEHTLFLLKNLTDFMDDESQSTFPLCYEIMHKQTNPVLIYLAGLFHDIGKGRGGDHSEIGAQEAFDFCKKHNLDSKHSQTISWLVANHLLMSLTAQKRDTSDPKVIKKFAEQVETPQRLELLYILTVADIRATNRSLWTSWKDSLLKELAITTLAYLNNKQVKPLENWRDTKQAALDILVSEGYKVDDIEYYWQHLNKAYFNKNPAQTVAWHSKCILQQIDRQQAIQQSVVAIRKRIDGGGSEIFVYSKDIDDLFARLSVTIAQQDLNVQGASIYTGTNGYCYDSFFTLNDTNKPIIKEYKRNKLESAIKRNISSLDLTNVTFRKRMPRQFKHFDVNTKIVFSNDEFSQYTRLDIVCRDRPGLLALLALAFKRCNVRIHDARITTLGEKAEDTFIISHKDNSAISGAVDRRSIETAINEQLK